MSDRALDLARIIFEAEPDAALGDSGAVERVTLKLARVTGAILSAILVRQGDEAFERELRKITQAIEEEARRTASMARALIEGDDPPDSLNQ